MVKRFLRSGRTGFYLAVVKEGNLGTGDIVARTPADERAITVAEVVNLYTVDDDSRELLQRAVKTAALPQGWRDHFQPRLWEADS